MGRYSFSRRWPTGTPTMLEQTPAASGVVVDQHADTIPALPGRQHSRCRTDSRAEAERVHAGSGPDAAARKLARRRGVEERNDVAGRHRPRLNVVEQSVIAFGDDRQRNVVASADRRVMLDYPADDTVGRASDVQRVGQHDRLLEVTGLIDPVRAGHLAVAVESEECGRHLAVPRVRIGKNGRRTGTNVTSFDFGHMRDADAGDVGDRIEWTGRKEPEVERENGQGGQEKHPAHASCIGLNGCAACRLVRAAWENIIREAVLAGYTGGVAILSLPEKLKVVKLWENLSAPALIEHAIVRGEGVLGPSGQLIVDTRPHTGRSPEGQVLRPRTRERNAHRLGRSESGDRPASVSTRCWTASPPTSPSAKSTRSTATSAPTNAIACRSASTPSSPGTICSRAISSSRRNAPSPTSCRSSPSSTRRSSKPIRSATERASATFILVNFARRMILIGGTRYAGEIKKSVFTVMNYLLPLRDVAADALLGQRRARRATSRSSSASRAPARRRSPPTRRRPLIGDDEHGWSADGVFNFEGGCYAKVIRLSPTAEPEIWAATQSLRDRPRERRLRSERRARSTSTRTRRPRTRAPPIRSSSSRTSFRRARRASRRRSSC